MDMFSCSPAIGRVKSCLRLRTALRLMANGARVEMLHAMAERPMSGQELAQKLNLNSGSVDVYKRQPLAWAA